MINIKLSHEITHWYIVEKCMAGPLGAVKVLFAAFDIEDHGGV